MATNKLNELRKLSSDLDRKKKEQEKKQKENLFKERNSLVNGALNKRQKLAQTVERRKKTSPILIYSGKPALIVLMVLLTAGIILSIIFAGEGKQPEISYKQTVTKNEIDRNSKDYIKITGYVKDIIDMAVNKGFNENTREIWHQNAAPETRYYSLLRLREIPDSNPSLGKIYHYPSAETFSCICSQKKAKHKLIFKIALENEKLKLVAVE